MLHHGTEDVRPREGSGGWPPGGLAQVLDPRTRVQVCPASQQQCPDRFRFLFHRRDTAFPLLSCGGVSSGEPRGPSRAPGSTRKFLVSGSIAVLAAPCSLTGSWKPSPAPAGSPPRWGPSGSICSPLYCEGGRADRTYGHSPMISPLEGGGWRLIRSPGPSALHAAERRGERGAGELRNAATPPTG